VNTAEHIAQLRQSAEASRAESAKQRKDAARWQAKADTASDAADQADDLARGWDEIADLLAASAVDEAEEDRLFADDDLARAKTLIQTRPAVEADEGLALYDAADRVHYTDPRVRQLAEARYRLETGGTRDDWLTLGKNNPDALIELARDWLRAAVAAGIIPPHAEESAL
jgi:hypothetical protein